MEEDARVPRPAPRLDDSNSKRYRARPDRHDRAVLRWEPASYELACGKQCFDGPHMVVDAPTHRYGVELRVFFATHRPVPDKRDHYFKDAVVRAIQVDCPTEVITEIDGRLEIAAVVQPGCWIIQNPTGEQYYNTDEDFCARYDLVEGRDPK